jgi:hypothetical protein
MRCFDALVAAYDVYVSTSGFDPEPLPLLVADVRAYFPNKFPIEAFVRIDFVIVDDRAAPLARLSFCVRGFDLRISADEETGMECDQEIIVPESIWRESLGGRLLRRDLFNLCVNRQLKPFKQAVAALRYFITYYFDFGDISPWIRISGRSPAGKDLTPMRSMRDTLAPQFSALDLQDEYADPVIAVCDL